MIITRTQRLIIRHITIKDSKFIFELMNSDNWLKFIGDKHIDTIGEAENYIKNNIISSYGIHGFGLYALDLIEDRKTIGICGFVKREFLDHPDLGFAILPEFERNGYCFEASSRILSYGRSDLHLEKILAITTKINSKSINLLRKLGMKMMHTTTNGEEDKPLIVFGFD